MATEALVTLDKARLRIERWPRSCLLCGCSWEWVLTVDADDPGLLLGCVRNRPVAEMIQVARRELARRGA
jgi:hypothetical protein